MFWRENKTFKYEWINNYRSEGKFAFNFYFEIYFSFTIRPKMKQTIRLRMVSFFILLTATHFASAQGYQIKAKIEGIRDSSLILGHYSRSNTQFIPKDTAKADAAGNITFEGSKNLAGGLYVILFPGNKKWIELVYSGKENNIEISTDTTNVVGNMIIKKSDENQAFYTYQKKLQTDSKKIQQLIDSKSPQLAAQQNQMQQDFKLYRSKFLKTNEALFVSKLLKMSADPDIPTAPTLPNGKSDSLWVYNYYKAHYWDNFDFSDGRILNTPFLEPKLDRYIKNLIPQTPDSLIVAADNLINRLPANSDIRKYVIFYITNQYENPTTVGTEGLWVHMAKKYYLTEEMGVSNDIKKKIQEKVNTLQNLLVSKSFPALMLHLPDGQKQSVANLKGEYNVLFFYSPTCGHCKEAAPELKAFYDKNKEVGVEVMAISTETNKEEWKDFIIKYNFSELKNGIDPTGQIDFYRTFDVVTTPTIYVLDKDKKIIARKLPIGQLDDFLNFYKNKIAK